MCYKHYVCKSIGVGTDWGLRVFHFLEFQNEGEGQWNNQLNQHTQLNRLC